MRLRHTQDELLAFLAVCPSGDVACWVTVVGTAVNGMADLSMQFSSLSIDFKVAAKTVDLPGATRRLYKDAARCAIKLSLAYAGIATNFLSFQRLALEAAQDFDPGALQATIDKKLVPMVDDFYTASQWAGAAAAAIAAAPTFDDLAVAVCTLRDDTYAAWQDGNGSGLYLLDRHFSKLKCSLFEKLLVGGLVGGALYAGGSYLKRKRA